MSASNRRCVRVYTHKARSQRRLEPLERRTLMSVAMGSDGWTDIEPSIDSRIVYVSNTVGDDLNDGLTADAPVKTLAKARTLIRSGSPDWMLLKRGDAWSENFSNWTQSGRNQQEPMVISAYGVGARPLLNTGSLVGFNHWVPVAHLSIIGVHFHAHTRDTKSPDYSGVTAGDYGFQSHGKLDNVLVENSVFDDYKNNVSVTGYDGPLTNFTLRRSIITDSWSAEGKSQGMYVHKTDRVLLEENLFDHNGWNGDVAGAGATIYSHGVYMSASNNNVVVRENIIADSASHGLQARSGGIIENNLFLRNPINLLFGGGSPTVKPGGVFGRVTGNVILDSRSINGSSRGTGMEFSNIKPGAGVVVSNNIITADTHRRASAITFGTTSDATNVAEATGLNDLILRDNVVYDWYSGVNVSTSFVPGATGNLGINNVEFVHNDFQHTALARLVRHGPKLDAPEFYWGNNRYDNAPQLPSGWFQVGSTTTSFDQWKQTAEPTAISVAPRYADPARSIFTYNASLGGESSLSGFTTVARTQEQGAFDGRYTAPAIINYIRRGFAENSVIPGGLLTVRPSDFSTGEAGDVAESNAPTAPPGLAVTGVTGHSVSLTWSAASDDSAVTGYQILRDGVQVAVTTRTSFTDIRVPDGRSYTYAVRAYDAARNVSSQSNPVSATTPDVTAPTVPANLVAADPTSTSIALRWSGSTDNVGVSGYQVFRNGVQIGTTSNVTYTDQGLNDGTSYTYSVKAYDAAGNVSTACESATGGTNDATAPTTPTGLAVTGATGASVSLSWNGSTDNVGVAGYRVYRDAVHVATTNGTTYTDDGLTDATTYAYTVKAVDAAGNASADSASANGTTLDVTAPTVPLDLVVTGASGNTVSLSWSASNDNVAVKGYRLYRDGAEIAALSGTTYTDAGREQMTSYVYRVVAYDAAGNASGASESVTGTTTDATPPAAPANVSVSSVTASSASLTWGASADNAAVAGYHVFRDGVQVGTTGDTSYTDEGLADATTYAYTVKAFDAAGNLSGASNTATATTLDVTAPTAPTGLAVTAVTGSSVSLSWNASTDNKAVTGYRVFRNGVQVASVATPAYTDSNLTAGTSFTYTVTAFDAAGNVSGASNTVTGVTSSTPVAPTALTGAVTQKKARLTWSDRSTNETGFYVFSSRDGITWSRYATTSAKSGTATVTYTTGTLATGKWYFRVSAFNSAGQSAATNVVQLTI